MGKQAHIIAIRAASLGELGWGISSHPADVQHFFDEGEVWVGPRPKLEEDERFVQPIPYVVVRRGEKILGYVRAGNEARLRDKLSIGFGGHIDVTDAVVDDRGVIDLRKTLCAATKRELEEELGLTLNDSQVEQVTSFTHVISADETVVDRVHVGFVATVDLATLSDGDFRFEHEIANARFMSLEELRGTNLETETWTELVLSAI